ncbi:hypothetical protein [Kitasatospora sp. MMS16-BH015]|uniref:hypothetical protein n=1 Tax=Kitasatospora sp. MMS16-BH015 TaxID=2018025 RepID=UPI0020C4732D|nr:hypothetical protein [Kitasatospora sp. MMS16-BH015]
MTIQPPTPPETEVHRVYQPVEIHHEDGSWQLGRINAWWHAPDGRRWCRLRVPRSGQAPHWVTFDPARLRLLQTEGT